MDSKTFFDNFSHLAETPNGVPQLRALILQLAVQGKLVPQDPRDEPSTLSRRGKVEKEDRLAATVSVRGSADSPEADLTFAIPRGWTCLRLYDLVIDFQNGVSKRKSSEGKPTAVIRLADIKSGELTTETLREIALTKEDRHKYHLAEGDILVTRVNGSADLVGRFTPCRTNRSWTYCDHFIRVRVPPGQACYRYLCIVANSPIGRSHIAENTLTTAGQKTVNQPGVGTLPVPLPPLAEQQLIVAKVDELMKLCDELKGRVQRQREARERLSAAALDRLLTAPEPAEFATCWQRLCDHFDLLYDAPETLAQLRQAILQLAVQGKLVPQNPDDEPVSQLLQRMQAEKTQLAEERKLRGKASVTPVEAGRGPFMIPSSWVWVPFGEVMISRDGERIPVSKDERNGRAKVYDYYGASGVIDKIDGYLFDKPLLLIGEDGANLINRSTPIAFIARGKYWVNNHAHVLDGISESFLRYVELQINAMDLKPYVTGTAQPKMNQAKMNSIPIALPPEAEQHRIVAKVDHLMSLCDALEAKLRQSQADGDRLLAAAVHQLLNGGKPGLLANHERGPVPVRI
jgi:type I restriction enzyme S subunit